MEVAEPKAVVVGRVQVVAVGSGEEVVAQVVVAVAEEIVVAPIPVKVLEDVVLAA